MGMDFPSPAVPGQIYAPPGGPVYIYQNDIWNSVVGGAATPPVMGDYVTPQMYGAKADGSTDDTAAFTAALAVGKLLFVPAGTYSVANITVPANRRIIGIRGLSIISARSGMVGPIFSAAIGASDITVEDLTLACNGIASRGYSVSGSSASRRHQVRGCYVLAPTDSGIYMGSVRDVVVADNIVDGSTLAGVAVGSTAKFFAIYGNAIKNGGGAGVLFEGSYGSIYGNTISDPGPNGDGITGYNDLNSYVSITGNNVYGSENHGIHVGGQNMVISDNVIEGIPAGSDGIMLAAYLNGSSALPADKRPSRNCVISGNSVTKSNRSNIECDKVEDSVIANNACDTSTSHGIYMAQSHRNVIAGNVVKAGVNGIDIRGSQNNTITGNRTSNCSADGYRFAVDAAVEATGNTVTGNTSTSDNRGFIESGAGTNNNVFTGNRVVTSVSGQDYAKAGTLSVFDNIPLEAFLAYNPIDLAVGAGETTTLPVAGAALGDFVAVSFSPGWLDVLVYAWVSAVDVISVRFYNASGVTTNLGSGTIRVRVTKQAG